MSNIVADAEHLARERHIDQRYGDRPYSAHLEAVVGVLREFGHDSPAMLAAGWLHDTVEDTGLTIDEVRGSFGAEVAELVWAVTGQGPNRKARVADTYRKLAAYPAAVNLKLADRLANVRSCVESGNQGLFQMYRQEWPAMRDTLAGHGDPALWAALGAILGPS